MDVFIIPGNKFSGSFIKKSRKLSKLREKDPIYILDMSEFQDELDVGNLNLKYGRDIDFIPLKNDWISRLIKKKQFESLLEKIEDNGILTENYTLDESGEYYVFEPKQRESGSPRNPLEFFKKRRLRQTKNKLLDIFKKYDPGWHQRSLNDLSRDTGMYYCCEPKTIADFEVHLKRVKKHDALIKEYDLTGGNVLFYAGALNRMDYGLSVVNNDRVILYANMIRRKYHGSDILGKYCFEVFPSDPLNHICENCPMNKVINGKPEFRKKYRCEVHKLSSNISASDVYFVSETASLYFLRNIKKNRDERVGINVVRDNTSRIIAQEFQKIFQRVTSIRHIVDLLKFALLGGTVQDFRTKFEGLFSKNKEFFNTLVERISYIDSQTKENKILNFGFGRFRYYRNIVDIFNKNYEQALQSGRHILQIYDAYDVNGQIDDFIGKTIDYNEGGKYFINKLEFDPSGHLNKKEEQVLLLEIKNNPVARKFAREIGAYIENSDSGELEEWYDIELMRENQLIGYVSVDWKGKTKINKNVKEELLQSLKEFMTFVNQSILRVADHRHLELTNNLKSIISGEHETKNHMYYEFSKELCESFKALKCEVYLFNGKDQIEREYLYYSGLVKNTAEKANDILPRRHNIGEDLVGNVLDIILRNDSGEIYKKCVNVLNYDDYDEFYRLEPKKHVCYEYKMKEEELISKPGYFGKGIESKNCLIAPIVYRDEPIGALKITNNLSKGELYFPTNDQRILYDVAGQLAIKINNYKLQEREKRIFNVFTELSEILRLSYGEIKDEDITDGIRWKIINELKKIVSADEAIYYLVEKDENFQNCLSLKVWKSVEGNLPPPKKICESCTGNFEHGKLFFDLIKDIDPDNDRKMKKLFEESGNKIICRRIDRNKNPFSVLFLSIIDKKFDEADLIVIETITKQIEAILTLRALKRQSTEIMENIAHQIISPLKGLETHCNNLLDNLLPEGDKNYFPYYSVDSKRYVFSLLISQTSHVRFIANSYQQFLTFESGKKPELTPTEFDLASVVIRAASIYRPIAISQGLSNIKVYNDNKTFLMIGDEGLLMHIFVCLIDNAIKYSDENKIIEIRVSEENNLYYVRIKNYGIVIEKVHWRKIFEREFRAPLARKRFRQGSGIGLYIIGKICDSIKGECYVENSHKKIGTIFTVKLPKAIGKTKK
jgi:signal transduction histidine kinase